MTQHVLGVKDQQFAEPLGYGAAAGLLYDLGEVFGRDAHLIGIITYQMFACMVVDGQLDELLQHLALTGGAYWQLLLLTFLGVGQESRELVEYR